MSDSRSKQLEHYEDLLYRARVCVRGAAFQADCLGWEGASEDLWQIVAALQAFTDASLRGRQPKRSDGIPFAPKQLRGTALASDGGAECRSPE